MGSWIYPGRDGPITSIRFENFRDGAAACAELHLPLHVFTWNERMAKTGLAPDALYLVRPDGYVALADSTGTGGRLRDYAARHFSL